MSDERSVRIETKIDKLSDAISEMRESMAADREARKDMARRVAGLEGDMKPVKRHMFSVHGIMMAVTFVGGIKGISALVAMLQR